jgi:3-dehydroquinate synthase
MIQRNVPIRLNRASSNYDIVIGGDLLKSSGVWAKKCLGGVPGKIVIVSNRKVFGLYRAIVENSLKTAGFEVSACLIGDGERFKNLKSLQNTLEFLGENRISRTDAIMALGGGVVGDLAGFAASIHLRGIPFLQVPTTLLSMIDSSVGGKTGVNSRFGKNLVGAFYQPNGVLIGTETLRTLPKRELTAGFCEAIKQGAIASKKLLSQTSDFLEKYTVDRFKEHFAAKTFAAELADLLAAQVAFKAKIVQNDERESVGKTDAASRKILNFGHTFAHAIEKITNYRHLKHGEAVGYGIMFAAELSKKLELCGQNEVNLLNGVVHRAGSLPAISSIDPASVIEAFKYDKKLVNDSLQWILLKGIGKPVIVPNKDIPRPVMLATIKEIIRK